MSYPPPNPNFSGGGNPQYNQPQVGSFGPPQPGGNPPGAGMGYSQQPGYGAPQGPPGGGAYGGAPGYGQPGGGSTYPGQGPGSFNPAGGPLPPPGGQRNMPPMGGGPPIMGPPGSGPPPPRSGQPGPGPLPPPQNRATFFSTASGAPIPSGSSIGGPPSSTNGGQAPPSFTVGSMAGGPPTAGPPGPGGPGSFYPGQTGGPPGGQMDGGYPPKPYGAAPNSSGFGMGLDATQRQPAQNGAFPGTQSWGGGSASVSTKEPTYDESQNYPNSLPLLNEIDLSCECNPAFMQATVRKIVVSQAAATASKIPIGIVIKPMAGDKGAGNDSIDVVDFGTTGIMRCKRCRTYINPYVTWADNGRRWKCNICGILNDVPTAYFSHLDANGQRRDRDQRPELCRSSVEIIAPGDYMVRPPQPPVYFFLIDVSAASAQSGMIESAVEAIKASLNDLPGLPRTYFGIITFDSAIHFYNLKSSLKSPQMLVVSELADLNLPLPEDLLVNLAESRQSIDILLDALPSMFSASKVQGVNTCTGPAINAAKRVMQNIGGKLLLFQSSLPSIGEGTLKSRDNSRMLGTDKEHLLLAPEEAWYKTNAIDCSRLQIAVDTFLFSGQYTDLATISILSKFSGGCTYFYPNFNGPRDGPKFEKELQRCLTRSTAFESVMRVRATRGMRITNFYGNSLLRGTDLLALPNCTSDSSFALDMAYDEQMLSAQVIMVQAALLYTSCLGERRIRVHNMVFPVTQSLPEMLDTVDIDCVVNILSKQAVDVAQRSGLDTARQRLHQTAVEILRASKNTSSAIMNTSHGQAGMGGIPNQYVGQHMGFQGQGGGQDGPIPQSLQLLPLYAMSIQKCLALRGGNEVRTDERAFYHQLLLNMDVEETKVFVYPRMFSIHDMAEDAGIPSDSAENDGQTAGPFNTRLPSILNLTVERLSSDGMYLLENGCELFFWVGRAVNPSLLECVFGVSSIDGQDIAILTEGSEMASRVQSVIQALRADRARHMHLNFIREGDGYAEMYFSRYLVEDRANFPGGALTYTEFFSHVTKQISGLPG